MSDKFINLNEVGAARIAARGGKLHGRDAIAFARYRGKGPGILNKYSDPIDGEVIGISFIEAARVCSVDPSLIWCYSDGGVA